MSGQITLRHRPDTDELAARREEFAELLTKLSERELEVSTLREDLTALEVRYIRDVGSLYEQLDAINKRIFELRILINPSLAEEQEQCGDQAQGGCGGSAAPHLLQPLRVLPAVPPHVGLERLQVERGGVS